MFGFRVICMHAGMTRANDDRPIGRIEIFQSVLPGDTPPLDFFLSSWRLAVGPYSSRAQAIAGIGP